jgi:hypothetical protein
MIGEPFHHKALSLLDDSGWRCALVILLHPRFANDARVWRYVHLDSAEIFFREMLDDGTFSGGERRMVSLAAGLFNGHEYPVDLVWILSGVDDHFYSVAMTAIQAYRGDGHKQAVQILLVDALQEKLKAGVQR